MLPSGAKYMHAVSNVHVFVEVSVMHNDNARTQITHCKPWLIVMLMMLMLPSVIIVMRVLMACAVVHNYQCHNMYDVNIMSITMMCTLTVQC